VRSHLGRASRPIRLNGDRRGDRRGLRRADLQALGGQPRACFHRHRRTVPLSSSIRAARDPSFAHYSHLRGCRRNGRWAATDNPTATGRPSRGTAERGGVGPAGNRLTGRGRRVRRRPFGAQLGVYAARAHRQGALPGEGVAPGPSIAGSRIGRARVLRACLRLLPQSAP
jgi:hypothetical protein